MCIVQIATLLRGSLHHSTTWQRTGTDGFERGGEKKRKKRKGKKIIKEKIGVMPVYSGSECNPGIIFSILHDVIFFAEGLIVYLSTSFCPFSCAEEIKVEMNDSTKIF